MKTIYTVGKAPIAHGIFESEERAWQAWDHWRSIREIPQRCGGVYKWPNGLRDDKGKVLLNEAEKLPRPAIIPPYDPADIPAPVVIATKTEVARILPADEPMSANSIGSTFARIEDYVRSLEELLHEKDKRIAELEGELAARPSAAVNEHIRDEITTLRARLDRLENKTVGQTVIGGVAAPLFPDLLANVSQAMNGEVRS